MLYGGMGVMCCRWDAGYHYHYTLQRYKIYFIFYYYKLEKLLTICLLRVQHECASKYVLYGKHNGQE